MKKLLLSVLSLFLIGCQEITINSFKDPDFRSFIPSKLLISCDFADLKVKQDTELNFVNKFRQLDITAVTATTLFPPTRTPALEEIFLVLNENNIDAILVVNFRTYSKSESYTSPQVKVTENPPTWVPGIGNLYFSPRHQVQVSPGSVKTNLTLYFDVNLFTIAGKDFKNIWLGQLCIKDPDPNLFIDGLTKTICNKLVEEWVVSPGACGFRIEIVPEGNYNIVKEVVSYSPAERAGLRVGDKIFKIDGKSIPKNISKLESHTLLWGHPGEKITLEIQRDDKILNIEMIREERQKVFMNWKPPQ
jgi:membrane-associated protease RseP (regulator of RpoE activity)